MQFELEVTPGDGLRYPSPRHLERLQEAFREHLYNADASIKRWDVCARPSGTIVTVDISFPEDDEWSEETMEEFVVEAWQMSSGD